MAFGSDGERNSVEHMLSDRGSEIGKSGSTFQCPARSWRWALGLSYIVAVAAIWIAASYIVQSVVGSGVSPFLITYICNSLFVIYLPIVELARCAEDAVGTRFSSLSSDSNNSPLLTGTETDTETRTGTYSGEGLDERGRWTRLRVAKISLLICPFWFLAQLTFNLSLKYTTVTSNTILSSTSSLFTFLVALMFLGESFTCVKFVSVLLCMAGTIVVSFGDSSSSTNAVATNPLLGDVLAILSAALYSVYITLIRRKLPGDTEGGGRSSTAQFLGFLGLFNMAIFLPVALMLNFTGIEPFKKLSWEQAGLLVGKGLLDNVLSDYLWAEAVHLTTTTVATAGLTVQVPIASLVDSLTGHPPHLLDYVGAAAVLLGFVGINLP